MPSFHLWPESRLRVARWALLSGWILLIAMLLLPGLTPWQPTPACDGLGWCRGNWGNDLFWNLGLPLVLLTIVVSHELWRRICPLSFVSQVFSALKLQRMVSGPKGKPRLVLVEPASWLGRHHIQLQWSLLLTGLSLRILVANSSALVLALLCLSALIGALVVGWAYGGKSWCQYFCPLGPVQTVITGPRGSLGTPAHLSGSTRTTQSMCRTVSAEGKDVSVCVACATPCIDIDSERSYWAHLTGKRGLNWAWYSYPGIVLAFYLLILATSAGTGVSAWTYLHDSFFTYDSRLQELVLQPMPAVGSLSIPRLVAIPAGLSLGAWGSVQLFGRLERLLERRLGSADPERSRGIAIHRTRLIATLVALNLFFFFKSNVFPVAGIAGERTLQFFVAALTAVWLFRSWSRDEGLYRRESTSESLRRQLTKVPGLDQALEGRQLADLSPLEVFTLAKALPVMSLQRARDVYQGVLKDLLRTGRISTASSMLQLDELRRNLNLEEQDHHAVVRQLAEEDQGLLTMDGLDQQRHTLRQDAAREALHQLMSMAGLEVLQPEELSARQREQLEQVRKSSGLDDGEWSTVLGEFGPHGAQEQDRLLERWQQLRRERGLALLLHREAESLPLLAPLARAMADRTSCLKDQLAERFASADLSMPTETDHAEGSLDEALDLLWQDPDPDTAGWVLLVDRQRGDGNGSRPLRQPRQGLPSSPFLESALRGERTEDMDELPILADSELFTDLPPSGLIQVAARGEVRRWAPGDTVFRRGDPCDGLGVVLHGQAVVHTADGQTVQLGGSKIFGEMAVIRNSPRSADLQAGEQGLQAFWLTTDAFDMLLHESRDFNHGVMKQLVEKIPTAGV
ncbi:cyclic nucleotide-binding domain-containing protein [Cyanobium sp. CH-040]|uniref:cyclic nucleotide-binding domain-containing protein n=1 Tax=Cyanobium sp. CH-040 TaxID=2823708 RepID=UPI0020CEDCC4|nr:cyclic nucleotide-binding domain-containing protein [Cyanobium sp. CH-040]MCP9927776.1 cyclic nucleotide-binding domain-containing protein [Cyanobium sp. CH-040]